MGSWHPDIHVSENSIRLGRKKHQIASNCVVLHLGTEIEIGSQWFIATADHKNAGTRNGGLADVALYYIGKGWSKHILISYLNHFFLIWVPPGLTSSCIYIYIRTYIIYLFTKRTSLVSSCNSGVLVPLIGNSGGLGWSQATQFSPIQGWNWSSLPPWVQWSNETWVYLQW